MNLRRDEESKPKRRHRATGRPRGGRRAGAGRKRTQKQTAIEEIAKRERLSVRTVQRAMRVKDYSCTLANEVNLAYGARKAGQRRMPLTWTWADRLVRTVLGWLRQGRGVEDIVTAMRSRHESSPVLADFYEKVAREIVGHEKSRTSHGQ